MELSEKELKELSKVSLDLQLKIKEWARLFGIVKKSHSLSTYMTIYKQRKAWQDEIDNDPFTIRGGTEFDEDNQDNSKDVKQIIADAMTARQNTETAMKIIKLLPDLDSDLEKLYIKMTTDEKTEVERVKAGEAENILALHLKKVNGEKA